jgi:hypothetical protein
LRSASEAAEKVTTGKWTWGQELQGLKPVIFSIDYGPVG